MGGLLKIPTKLNLDDEEKKLHPGDWDLDKDSLAVIASNGQGNGCILWHVGGHIVNETESVGFNLADLGLDDAPFGLSIWEGKFINYDHSMVDGHEYEAEPSGIFRNPTFEEWAAIIAGVNPWRQEEWRIK